MTAQMSHLYGFTKVIKFIAYVKKLLTLQKLFISQLFITYATTEKYHVSDISYKAYMDITVIQRQL